MLTGVLVMAGLAGVTGGALVYAAGRIRQNPESPVDKINALLPQTQCGQCGYPGCRPYAEAVAAGAADIDQCAPGGDATVAALAGLLGRPAKEVNPEFGSYVPPAVAFIDEPDCIGCTLCIEACPVDAIVGSHRFTHTVIAAECTGCELCIAPCPVDCIRLEPLLPAAGQGASA
jgi:electron transport complex protein RnfB